MCAMEGFGLLAIAPYWREGTIVGEVNALAMFVFGMAALFFLLGRCEPGKTLATQGLRYLFALMGGTATNVVLTWGLWSVHFPMRRLRFFWTQIWGKTHDPNWSLKC
ncbi:hypothetical protein C5615_32695 [Burkholderia cepacia]|uniref:Uncharacterized protein n=1 Tax=Burkholderia cepacia TaxID=292 RepID=A0A2S8I7Q4_BURCE|nr:hypothetical protein C5615_32695 [Burkholderia cepacia]